MLAGPQAVPKQIWKILSTDRKSGVSQPVSKVYTQKGKTGLKCILHLSGLFLLWLPLMCFPGKQQIQGALWHKETPEILPGKGSAWSPCLAVGTALYAHQPPAWGIGFACVEALCSLLLLCGSRGEHTQLLHPGEKSQSCTWGRETCSLRRRQKKTYSSRSLAYKYCTSQQPFNSEWSEKTLKQDFSDNSDICTAAKKSPLLGKH